MATALTSLVTGRPVRSDTAMTGEITLKGLVLPIGGLKEKSLAAQRAGITRVIAPKRNEGDLEDFPANLTDGMEFLFADSAEDVLAEALEWPRGRAASPVRRAPKGGRRAPGRTRDPVAAGSRVPQAKPG